MEMTNKEITANNKDRYDFTEYYVFEDVLSEMARRRPSSCA